VGLEGPAQAHCVADVLEVIPVIRVGRMIVVVQPDGKFIIDKCFVVHEIQANEGDNVVTFIDHDIKM